MLLPSMIHHRSCRISCECFVPDTFGVLCWNIYKQNSKHPGFDPFLKRVTREKEIDIVLLQEANFRDDGHFILPNFAFDAAANMEYRGEFYGVLTASRIESRNAQAYLTEGRESLFGTHKSLLMSTYPFEDGSTLLVLNVHAINFRENKRYFRELERFFEIIQDHDGPMIIAGDFNAWNKKRLQKLHKVREELTLDQVPFKRTDKVKSFMGNHLDFIFYRGMELVEFSVLNDHGLSDHNPLLAHFRKKG